ncbi:RNA polymerase III subunit RPC82 helix-turn-helix domain [Carpediemonas membranifera]|uniref:DNA-directed RNA polymerase III subunit RPC3 n=1 Tax=Carpediemonas membranifera TaxID=201153 RepID=A0A8J6E007_9EUKA|nr:RNA polymerase III subunit RPC82 helix-turn-helix domain [Carpediemonas membranifera]|eukprot:KAG9391478.1 RNA polymerase III subunit RPC82 helix-turn-helix domain [Carpediemonas membranifera]
MLYTTRLLERIVSDRLGKSAADIIVSLLNNPGSNTEDLSRNTGLAYNVIRQLMLRLMQHGMIVFDDPRYIVVTPNIYFHLFVPNVMNRLNSDRDDAINELERMRWSELNRISSRVFQMILDKGRMTVADVLEELRKLEGTVPDLESLSMDLERLTQQAFANLSTKGFIVRAETVDKGLFRIYKSKKETLGRKSTAPTKRVAVNLAEMDETEEGETSTTRIDPTVLFTVATDSLMRCMKLDIITSMVADLFFAGPQYRDLSPSLVRAILEAPGQSLTLDGLCDSLFGKTVMELQSTVDTTGSRKSEAEKTKDMSDLQKLRQMIKFMINWADFSVIQTEHGSALHEGTQLTINMADLWEHARGRAFDQFIRLGYGREAVRVWRFVREKKQTELKQMADACLLPAKEVSARAHALMNDGLMKMQSVPRTTDHAPGRSLYIYSIDEELALECLLERAAESMLHLLVRVESEMARLRELTVEGSADIAAAKKSVAAIHRASTRVSLALFMLDVTEPKV